VILNGKRANCYAPMINVPIRENNIVCVMRIAIAFIIIIIIIIDIYFGLVLYTHQTAVTL
jgi:hypothetical protein